MRGWPVFVAVVCATGVALAVNEDAAQRVRRARAAAGEDRHREAIALYLEAAALDRDVKPAIAKELALQYTWAEVHDSAVVWFTVATAYHPEDFENHLGLARALAWSDRHDQAIAYYRHILPMAGERETEVRLAIAKVTSWKDDYAGAVALYDSILADEPDNLDARVGRAQTINWSGRHREAASLYDEMLAAHPDNAEVRGGLAEAYRWMGRPDLAAGVLAGADGDELAELSGEIARARAPGATYTYAQNRDSDDIERRRHEFIAGLSPDYLSRGRGYYAHTRITQPLLPEVARDELKLLLDRRFSSLLALSFNLGYQWNDFNRTALGPEAFWKEDLDLFVFDGYLTVTPGDYLRMDFGAYRGSLDNPEPVFRGISVFELNAGVDWRFTPRWMAVTSAAWTDFSDDNDKFAFSERLVWEPRARIPGPVPNRVRSHTVFGFFDFSKTLDHGYYNPDRYLTLYERLEIEIDLARFQFVLGGRIGLEKEDSADWYGSGALDGSVSARVAGGFTLTAGVYASQSRLDTRSGYNADGFTITADYRFAR
ncbi:MAG: tetratricopeptide repeat protein [Candidatus Krumholzibacteria bacterium]|nr:tetratricopeptide repeat protein [Candidatus Krumholzibacteria bacterium]